MPAKIIGSEINAGREDLARENARLRGDLMTVARRVSHDLRTPLGGIISAGEALKEILADTDPDSMPMVTSALESTEELSHIIKRTSFVLKATAQPEPPQPISMAEPVIAALQRLERRTVVQRASIGQPDSWPEINGVSAWLETVWWNLVANALQHANATPLRIELGWEKVEAQHCFRVCDNGRGVLGARQKQLFQPFERLHEPDAGPGLGLSIVRRLVELQGGTCGYEANPLGGACFSFVLP
jgi:signal transduction histidine kinase